MGLRGCRKNVSVLRCSRCRQVTRIRLVVLLSYRKDINVPKMAGFTPTYFENCMALLKAHYEGTSGW